MQEQYRLPDGFTVTARGEADSTWNGWPVPILSPSEYHDLRLHLVTGPTYDGFDDDEDDYRAEYVDDGKVTAGYYCDGLVWTLVQDTDTTDKD